MIEITDRFYISADTNCYKVLEKTQVQDEKSENYGKDVFENVGYFVTIEQCINGILKAMSREYVAKETKNTMQDLKDEIRKQNEIIRNSLKEIKDI